MNNKVNCLHERCLRIVYSDKKSSFETLFEKDGSVTIHTRIFVNSCDRNVEGLQEVFSSNNSRPFPCSTIVKSVYHGAECLSNLGPRRCGI